MSRPQSAASVQRHRGTRIALPSRLSAKGSVALSRSDRATPRSPRRRRTVALAAALAAAALLVAPEPVDAYTYYKSITVARSRISGGCGTTLSNYPMLFSVTDPDLAHTSSGGRVEDLQGDDIIFRALDTATCGGPGSCVLDHEIEKYDPTTGQLVAWVRIPSLNTTAAASDTVIYVYYGDRSVTSPTENPTGVWDASYVGVWHLEEQVTDDTTGGIHDDSTANANDGTQTNNGPFAGMIADAQDFDGVGDFITVADHDSLSFAPNGPFSASAWVYVDTATRNVIVSKEAGAAGPSEWDLSVRSAGELAMFVMDNSFSNRIGRQTLAAFPTGSWHHVSGTYDGSGTSAGITLYIDGVQPATADYSQGIYAAMDNTTTPVYIGTYNGGTANYDMDGRIDEVRLSNTARSSCWVGAEYQNENDPGDIGAPGFYAIGTEVAPYSYYKPVTVDRSKIPGGCGTTLSNYPMLFSVHDPDLAHTTSGGDVTDLQGDDIVFKAHDAATCGAAAPCTLDHEIEKYVSTTGELVAWVRIPSVNTAAAASDTVIYVYYGNTSVTTPTENPSGVWDPGYAGVWHLHDDFLDSTSNANNGANSGSLDVAAKVADGQSFDGVNDYIDVGSGASIDQVFTGGATIEAWIRPTGWGQASFGRILDKVVWGFFVNDSTGNNTLSFGHATSGTSGNWRTDDFTIQLNQWQHVAVSFDNGSTGNNPTLYINGVSVNVTEYTTPTGSFSSDAAGNLLVGDRSAFDRTFSGGIDEVRVSNATRSSCWIGGEFANHNNPGDITNPPGRFYTIGSALATAVELVSFTASPLDGAVQLSWETGSEVSNLGFHLYRGRSAEGPWERITTSLIPGLGSSPVGAVYGYTDTGLVNGVSYFYLLEDVETTGATKRHGPVSAMPSPAAGRGEEDAEADAEDPTVGAGSWIRYGDPEATSLRVVSRGESGAVLELATGGFYALPQADGTVVLHVPGFDSLDSPGEPDLPVRRAWIDAVAGERVWIGSVRVGTVESFDSLRPADAGVPEAVVYSDGTVRAGRRAAQKRFRGGEGLFPEAPVELLDTGFQGELKKALVQLAPLRWDPGSGQLLLARRLEVSVSFAGYEPEERGLGGARGRKEPKREERGRPVDEARVLAFLGAPSAGPYGVAFEAVVPGQGKALRSSALRLSRRGEDVAFHVAPDPDRFAPGSTLYFVSPGPGDNPDAREAVYALEAGVGGTTMATVDARPSGPELLAGRVRRAWESDRLYLSALLDAPDPWLWDVVIAPGAKSYPFSLDRVVPGATGGLEVDLVGGTDTPEDPDHHVAVSLNGVLLAEVTWDGRQPYSIDAEVPSGVLVEGANSLEIHDLGDTGASVSGVYLDRFALTYERALVADTGLIEAAMDASGQALVAGLSSGAVVFDTTDPGAPAWLAGAQWTRTGLAFRAGAGRRVLAASPTAVRRPTVRPATDLTALRDTQTLYDYVAIGPRELLEAAAPLFQWRRDQGLRVLEVPLEDLYDAFSGGEPHRQAIHDFLCFAFHDWPAPPRYVLLLGDSSYDGKGRLGFPDRDQVPPFMIRTPYMWTVSDAAYAAVNGDDRLPDLAIGRLPAATVEEARALAVKVVSWERDANRFEGAPAVLVADNADAAGDFPRDAEEIAQTLLAGRDVELIRLDQLGGATRSAIRDAFDRGAGIVSYLGHGALALWASENIFNTSDVKTLGPQPQQPLLLTMDCLNGYILHPVVDSLAEAFLKAEGRGAVATFSPSSLSLHWSARRYHDALLDEVLSGHHPRLGDALLAAQARYAAQGALPDLLDSYLLLADPATSLR